MSMMAPKQEGGGKDFESHPAGGTTMVCTRIIDKGTHSNPKKPDDAPKRKIVFVFESSQLMKEGEYAGKPFLLFVNFNYSMYQNAHLCKFIGSWNGTRFVDQNEADSFDIATLLGKPLFASVVINGDWTNVESPMPVPNGMAAPTIVGESYLFSFQAPDVKAWEKISEKMRGKMMESPEYQEWVDSPIPGPDTFETMPDAPANTGQGMNESLKELEGAEDPELPF